MALELFYPVKNPINPTNLFGTKSSMYSSLGQVGHPGEDFECPMYTPVYAPCDGDAFYVSDKYGGDGLWIRVPNNAKPAFNIILYHLVPKGTAVYPYSISTILGDVTAVKAGQLLAYSGNSGYPVESSGPHLHVGVMPCDLTGEALNRANGFLGCVDPAPYWNGKYAEDINKQAIIQTTSDIVQEVTTAPISPSDKLSLLGQLKSLLLAIAQLFK